jgi:transcriptional regulator with XRE-family HTH domain
MDNQTAPKTQSKAPKSAPRTTLLGVQLRRLRERRGWSQGQLAEASGVEKSTISRLESGLQRTAHDGNLEALARVLQVPAALLKEAGQRPDTPPSVALLPFLQAAKSAERKAGEPTVRLEARDEVLEIISALKELMTDISYWARSRQAAIWLAGVIAEKVSSREIEADELREPLNEILCLKDIHPALRQTLEGIVQQLDGRCGKSEVTGQLELEVAAGEAEEPSPHLADHRG